MPRSSDFRPALERALAGIAPQLLVLEETGSTNDEARALAREGAPHLSTVVTGHQTAGRGRRGRSWVGAPGESLLASWVVRPSIETERWPLLPLLAGLACAQAARERTRVGVTLKWPNDLMVGDRKLGGILVEAEPPAFAIVGVGINVGQTTFPDEIAERATSLALNEAVRLDRADLLAAILRRFEDALADPDTARVRYAGLCSTIGRRVRVDRAAAEVLEGMAVGLDPRGALVIEAGGRVIALSAGDVEHLR